MACTAMPSSTSGEAPRMAFTLATLARLGRARASEGGPASAYAAGSGR